MLCLILLVTEIELKIGHAVSFIPENLFFSKQNFFGIWPCVGWSFLGREWQTQNVYLRENMFLLM